SGNVGIGDTTPSYKLEVNTDVSANYVSQFFNDGDNADRYGIQIQAGADDASGTTYYINALDGNGDQVGYIANTSGTFALTDTSDIRTKTNIVTAEMNATSILSNLRVVNFNRISNPDGPQITGFIAQEVQEIYPNAVNVGPTGLLGIAKDAFIPVLVKAFQENAVRLTSAESNISSALEQTEITTNILTDLNLKTDQNITTLSELQTSVDAQLVVISTTLNAQTTINSEQETAIETLSTDYQILSTSFENLQTDANVQASKTALLETQMQTLVDFYTAFDLGNLVAKDADGNIDLTRDALGNPLLLGGKLKATILETGGLVIEVADPDAPTIGTVEILPAALDADSDGEDDISGLPMTDEVVLARDGQSVQVMTKAMIPMAEGARVFTTFKSNPNAFSWIEKIANGDGDYIGFSIHLSSPVVSPVTVDWLLVEEKDGTP
ncbi:MAG TPA: tail fiber domain-containing protein, partial [Patescibacteria group bacterium]|nr:tail fiber domain-containing protein [Patescibacteria group bacterium]